MISAGLQRETLRRRSGLLVYGGYVRIRQALLLGCRGEAL
jgi:hypothetical protein